MTAPFVTPEWLAARLGDPEVTIVDASWHMPAAGRDARAEFAARHIPGAVFFDIDAIADAATGLPHMLPSPEEFARLAGAAGIPSAGTLVVYDSAGLFSAPRVWWTLRTMGAADVRILEGGLPRWIAEAQPVESGAPAPSPRAFTPTLAPDAVAGIDKVRRVLAEGSAQVVDARPADRFAGAVPEPRPGLRSGHMPGARSLPAGSLVANGSLKPTAEIGALVRQAGIDPARPVVTTCGSGVTAATALLALETLGATRVALYDGSWAEWGGRDDTPVATGPA